MNSSRTACSRPQPAEEPSVNAFGQSQRGTAQPGAGDQFVIASLNRELEVMQGGHCAEGGEGLAGHWRDWVFMVTDAPHDDPAQRDATLIAPHSLLGCLEAAFPLWFVTQDRTTARTTDSYRTLARRWYETTLSATSSALPGLTRGGSLAMAWVLWPQLLLLTVGAGHCYLLREGGIRRLDRDLPQDHHQHSPGIERTSPELSRLQLALGDTLILCNEALSSAVGDARMRRLVSEERFAKARCQALIEAARDTGSSADITVVVASFLHRRGQ